MYAALDLPYHTLPWQLIKPTQSACVWRIAVQELARPIQPPPPPLRHAETTGATCM